MSDKPDIGPVLDAIVDGRLDDELVDLFTAVVGRNDERAWSMTWELRVPHPTKADELVTVAEQDLTIAEWRTAEELTGRTWVSLDPKRSSQNMGALVTAVFEHRCGMSRVEADAAVSALSGVALLDALHWVEVPRRPLSAGR
jgi:hypothetical protein